MRAGTSLVDLGKYNENVVIHAIRRLGADLLIISDAHGVQYLIRKLQDMDRQSRKLLDRFL